MESPVRICLGAVILIILLQTLIIEVNSNALPQEITSATTVKDERYTRYKRLNSTLWNNRNKSKIPDVALNELNPKVTTSEENTEKNAKYKDRGRIRFNIQTKTSSESPLKRITSTKGPSIIIVTPTPEVKKPAEIIDSMHKYKKTKMPIKHISSTSPSYSASAETQSDEEFDEDDEYFDKYTSSKDDDSNVFTFPSFNTDDLKLDESEKLSNDEHSSPFSATSYFTKNNFVSKEEPYKTDFFNFDSDLTTPKNDFFDKKYKAVSKSILKNLESVKSMSPPTISPSNISKVNKINIGLEKTNNNSPHNTSKVFIKNTKEIRYLDNEHAGTANKELSDVHGTSMYYEMTVFSTETYNIKGTDDDECDNDTLQLETTTTKPTLQATQPSVTIKNNIDLDNSSGMSQASSNLVPESIIPSLYRSKDSGTITTQNILSYSIPPTETYKQTSSISNRNKNFAKRLNFANHKDSPNSVTLQSDQSTFSQASRQQIRRFHHTTPKVKPIWMAPRKNVNRTATRTPMTIYSEHFDINDKFTSTKRPAHSSKPVLTTFASEIDPVLQSDVSGTKKVVHSPSISDNTIPSLWKRGSTKFVTSSATSTEAQFDVSDLEIPPTLTAWALASMRSPPSASNPGANATGSTPKSVDENELQKVGDVTDKRETSTTSTTTTTLSTRTDFLAKNITEMNQNKLHLKPNLPMTTRSSDLSSKENTTESFSERLPAESNISLQSSKQPLVTEPVKVSFEVTDASNINTVRPTWVSASSNVVYTTEKDMDKSSEIDTIPPVDATKSTGFESITKLPSGVTTPKDELPTYSEEKSESVTEKTIISPTTNDYEITTIRFSYLPTEDISKNTETDITTVWHPAFPTRSKPSTVDDVIVTTYRPQYITTTESDGETTTTLIQTHAETSTLITGSDVTSEIIHNSTENSNLLTEITDEITSSTKTTEPMSESSKELTTDITTVESTVPLETTTQEITVEIENEITTELETSTNAPSTIDTTEMVYSQTFSNSEENSESNEVLTHENKILPTTTTSEKSTVPITIKTSTKYSTAKTTEFKSPTTGVPTTTKIKTTTELDKKGYIIEITTPDEATMDTTTKSINDLEDLTSFVGEMTTETSSRVLTEEAGSGAGIAIAVSIIGVIALVLLIGLLIVVRRRGRRGVYAQRCTPVSLDAYSLDSVSIGHRKGHQRIRASKRSYGNPAYDDEVTSHPMNYAALANFALDVDSITSEFAEIPSVTVRPEDVPPGCEDKNRYSNVLPLPETRVPLKRLGNDITTEYINANYVTGPGNIRNFYILCQAPLANTVVDFWRMIWEQNSRLVVMLTEYMENGVEKCYEYLPPSEISDNRRTFGNFQIILKKREQRDKYAISSVQLINLATRTWREVTHLWYFWPAKGVPDDYDSVIDFLFEMRSYMKVSQTAKEYDEEGIEIIYEDENRSSYNNLMKLRSGENGSGNGLNVYSPAKAEEKLRRDYPTNGTLGKMKAASEIQGVRPCVVACASGAGRSAALVAAEESARALAAGRADVPRAVRRLRMQRPHSLTNKHHYIFLYKLLSEYGNKLMGGGVDTI